MNNINDLKRIYLEAELRYLEEISKTYQKNFCKRLDEINRPIYLYPENADPDDPQNLTDEEKEELKRLYHQLSLKYHPDKKSSGEGENNDSNFEIMAEINRLYTENNLEELREIGNSVKKTSKSPISISKLEKEISKIKATCYYCWNVSPKDREFIESQYGTVEDLRRLELEKKLRDDIERLKAENEKIRREIVKVETESDIKELEKMMKSKIERGVSESESPITHEKNPEENYFTQRLARQFQESQKVQVEFKEGEKRGRTYDFQIIIENGNAILIFPKTNIADSLALLQEKMTEFSLCLEISKLIVFSKQQNSLDQQAELLENEFKFIRQLGYEPKKILESLEMFRL